MKKLFVLLAVLSLALVVEAKGELDYVTIGDKTYFSDDIKIGASNLRICTENGLTIKAPMKKIDAYLVKGRRCKRLPLISYNGEVKCTGLLELVSFRNGLNLYKYHPKIGNKDLGCCFYEESGLVAMFFVYKNEKLYLRVNKNNAKTIFPFFGVTYKINK